MFNKKLKAHIAFLRKENIALYFGDSELRKVGIALQVALSMRDGGRVESGR